MFAMSDSECVLSARTAASTSPTFEVLDTAQEYLGIRITPQLDGRERPNRAGKTSTSAKRFTSVPLKTLKPPPNAGTADQNDVPVATD